MTRLTSAFTSTLDGERAGIRKPLLVWGCGPRLLTLDQLADWLSVPPGTIRTMVKRRTIPYQKVGRALRFHKCDIEEWTRHLARPSRATAAEEKAPADFVVPLQRICYAPGEAPSPGVTYD